MRSSCEEFPPRRAPQQSLRLHEDGPHSDRSPSQPAQPQHHQLSPEIPPVGGAHIFALFYSLIFSVVHAALTMVFTPVLGNSSNGRQQTPAAVRRRESSSRSLSPPRENDSNTMVESDDPELAMVDNNNGGDGGGGYHQHIPTYQSLTSSSRSSRSSGRSYILSSVDENKVVRFPGQGRIRPPLGRIVRLSSLSSISSGGSSPTSTSSSSSSSRSGGRRERSRPTSQQHQTTTSPRSFRSSGPVPRTSSPFGRMTSPRMSHSTYFLE